MPWPTGVNALGGLIKVTIEGRLHGSVTNNVLWFASMTDVPPTDWTEVLSQLGANILDCIVTHLLPGLSSQWTFDGVRCTVMSTAAKEEVFTPSFDDNAGLLAESLPATDAAVVSLKTPYMGKSNRGRFYIAGVPEANHALSTISGPTLAAIGAFVGCMLGKYAFPNGTQSHRWVVFSRLHGYASPSTYTISPATTSPVTNAITRTVLGTMRSRRVGRGA